MYALIKNGAVSQYPYSFLQLQQANPNVSFPLNSDGAYEAFGMFRVYTSQLPSYSSATQKLAEGIPVFDDNLQRWLQSWSVVDLTPEEIEQQNKAIQDAIVSSTQSRLDYFARTRNYDGILSACTYAASTNTKFNAEGQYCVEARDATWAKLYEILAEVEAGTRPMPTGYADIEAELPALTWPN